MADHRKCPGFTPDDITCPMRESCWRYTAPDSTVQSYMHAPMYQLSDGGEWKCDEYWKIQPTKET